MGFSLVGYMSVAVILLLVKNPLLVCVCLLFMASMAGLLMMKSISLWIMNAVILVFLGGMMVIFIYISILSNDEKFEMGKKNIFWALGLGVVTLISGMKVFSVSQSYSQSSFMVFSLFKGMYLGVFLFLMLFLLFALFSVTKYSESFKGTLVKFK